MGEEGPDRINLAEENQEERDDLRQTRACARAHTGAYTHRLQIELGQSKVN